MNEDNMSEDNISEDIGPLLKEWDQGPDSGSIRKIAGSNSKDKIQIRVQFGMLQLEADGRPDGKRPYGQESLLDHYSSLLEDYRAKYETDDGFELDSHDCERLRNESMLYYHRYASLFELGDYHRAERDTARNLRVLDLVKRYAEYEDEAFSLERYRPYISMMNARAKAFICMDNDDYAGAIRCVNEAMESITDFYNKKGIGDSQIEESQELAVLRSTAKEIRNKCEGTADDDTDDEE